MEPRRRRFVLATLFLVLVYFIYAQSSTSIPYGTALYSNLGSALRRANTEAANATLGFGAIIAVSHTTSPRRNSLIVAANVTELEITIPDQPLWTEKDIHAFLDPTSSIITRGSALAWLGHLNALRWFLSTDLETALIIEDDVDWDIRLRTTQVPKVAAAARTLIMQDTNGLKQDAHELEEPSFISPEDAGGYWGSMANPAGWDLMYLGHCGDIFESKEWNNLSRSVFIPRASFLDTTLPEREDLHEYTKDFLDDLAIPPNTRLVHKSVTPLCTFGFAVTRRAAERLLYDIAPKETSGGAPAYDVRILEACRDLGFRCWSTNPELFHHQDRESLIASVNEAQTAYGGKSKEKMEDEEDEQERRLKEEAMQRWSLSEDDRRKQDQEKMERERQQKAATKAAEDTAKSKNAGIDTQGRLQGAAPNIKCGVRAISMYSENPDTIEYLREVVGRQGMCLRDEMAEDMSKWSSILTSS